jgi:hypothetical protein
MPPGSGTLWHVTAAPAWTILIPTIGERAELFRRLMTDHLLPQVDRAGGRVLVRAWLNNGSPPLPEIRQRMVMAAATPYLSFVDDDDLVSPDFVPEVLRALESGPDYVGFRVQCYSNGAPTAVAHHSLAHRRWYNDRRGGRYLRDISHINPMRTRLAQGADFRRVRPGRPEDRAWVEQLRAQRTLRTEVVIDRIMYHYLYSTSTVPGEGSRWERHRTVHPADLNRLTGEFGSPYFAWSPDA